jgi:ferredoxin--NADP+ reductase
MIDGKSEFACVDGPEFDGHKVNFEVLVQRNAMYRDAEQKSMEEFRRASDGTHSAGACVTSAQGEAR